MRRARVLVVFSSSELGGAERSLTRMALAANGGVDFALATLDGPGPWADWCCQQGVKPFVLGRRRSANRHGRFGVIALMRLAALVRRERYPALYVIGLRASIWLRLMRPWLRNVRLVHGIRWNPDSNSRLDRAFRLVERMLGSLIDCYICNSKAAAATLAQRVGIPQKKIRVIYNGLEHLPPAGTQQPEHAPRRILTVANLSPRKGYVEYLEQVVAPLSKCYAWVRFVIVGRDEMAGTVQRRVEALGLQKAVTFTGFRMDVSEEFNTASVFVLPSLWNEGCPTAILEAMAYRLPVVAFAMDGIPELIDHEVEGLLTPPRDYAGMAKAIETLLAAPALSARLGQAGRSKVASRFLVEHSVNAHVLTFKELLISSRE